MTLFLTECSDEGSSLHMNQGLYGDIASTHSCAFIDNTPLRYWLVLTLTTSGSGFLLQTCQTLAVAASSYESELPVLATTEISRVSGSLYPSISSASMCSNSHRISHIPHLQRVFLGYLHPALITNHKSVNSWLRVCFHDLDVVTKNAAFNSRTDTIDSAVPQDNAVFNFAIADFGPVAD